MKLYVVSEDLETFDVIVGVKHRDANDIKLFILSYATGSLKHVIQKRWSGIQFLVQLSEQSSSEKRTLELVNNCMLEIVSDLISWCTVGQ